MRLSRYLPLATVVSVVVMSAGAANAGFIISTTVPANVDEIRVAGNSNGGITTAVDVGGSNVTINSFGVFGQQLANGNLKFLIFGPSNRSTPLYDSGSISTAVVVAAVNQWYDAPAFSFTLIANTSYRIGVISDQDFNYNWGFGPQVTGGGLTLPSNANGNTGSSYANPVNLRNGGTIQQSFRAFQGDVTATPLPPTVFLAAGMAGLFGLRSLRRRLA